jgi:serine/threonine protein kinase
MDRWRQIEALFEAAVKRPPSDRDAYLRRACARDLGLYREVLSLLSYDADGTNDEPWAARAAEALLQQSSRESSSSSSSLAPGMSLGPYRVIGLLGAGAMGEVYRASDSHLNREVALKVLPELFALDPDRLARLKREAQVLASLNHQNIAAIHGFEARDGIQALVLEFVDGATLAQRIAHGPILLQEALPIAKQIAEALEAAHERGIVHRDLKPANIKVQPDGTVKLLDFGLAKAIDPISGTSDVSPSPPMPGHELTDGGAILGTWAYMSPEQARGMRVDSRTDVWAFGCVLYEMLTGQRAFDGPTSPDVVAAVLERQPDFGALPAGTPESISRLLRRALIKDVRNRLHAIGDARVDLVEALASLSGTPSRARSSSCVTRYFAPQAGRGRAIAVLRGVAPPRHHRWRPRYRHRAGDRLDERSRRARCAASKPLRAAAA